MGPNLRHERLSGRLFFTMGLCFCALSLPSRERAGVRVTVALSTAVLPLIPTFSPQGRRSGKARGSRGYWSASQTVSDP